MTESISEAAARVVQAVIDIEKAEGRGAGYQDIANRIRRGLGTVQDHVEALTKKGYLKKTSKYYGIFALLNPDGSERERAERQLAATDGEIAAGKPNLRIDEPPTVITMAGEHRQLRIVVLESDDDAHDAKRGDRVFVEDVEPESDRDWIVDGGVVRELRRSRV